MTEHDAIRHLLALAPAGALGPEETRRVERHARTCEACRLELDRWAAYMEGLRKLPRPFAPEGLLERTRATVLAEHAMSAQREERRAHESYLAALALFGWMSSLALWFFVREITGGMLIVFGANLADGFTWLALSAALSWATAGAGALLLGKRQNRRFYEPL